MTTLETARLKAALSLADGNITLEQMGNRLTLKSDEFPIRLEQQIPVEDPSPNGDFKSVYIKASALAPIIKGIRAEQMQLGTAHDGEAPPKIKVAYGSVDVSAIGIAEPSKIPWIATDSEPTATFDAAEFRQALRTALEFAVDGNGLRPALEAIHIRPDGTHTIFEATDQHRLIQIRLTEEQLGSFSGEMLIPRDAAAMLVKLIGNDTGSVDVRNLDYVYIFTGEHWSLECRTIEGRFPDCGRVIQSARDGIKFKVYVDRQALIDVIAYQKGAVTPDERISASASSVLSSDGEELVITASNNMSNLAARIPLRHPDSENRHPDGLLFCAAPEYLLSILKAFDSPEIRFCLAGDPLCPIVVTAPDGNDAFCILMPRHQ